MMQLWNRLGVKDGRMSPGNRKHSMGMELANEAKALVGLAFHNGPTKTSMPGKNGRHAAGKQEYSHITQDEMKKIMKRAVDKLYAMLWIRTHSPEVYEAVVKMGNRYTTGWDLPEKSKEGIDAVTRLAGVLGPA